LALLLLKLNVPVSGYKMVSSVGPETGNPLTPGERPVLLIILSVTVPAD